MSLLLEAFDRDIDFILNYLGVKIEPEQSIEQQKSKGHVVRAGKAATFNPDAKRSGGRLVRSMPRQLRKAYDMQEAGVNEQD